jgi:hypothetical protein
MKLEVKDLEKITLLPGETLVVKVSRSISPVYSKNFETRFRKIFPDNKLLFIADGLEINKIIKGWEG